MRQMKLADFLRVLARCTGDEAIELVEEFQQGTLEIEGLSADDC